MDLYQPLSREDLSLGDVVTEPESGERWEVREWGLYSLTGSEDWTWDAIDRNGGLGTVTRTPARSTE